MNYMKAFMLTGLMALPSIGFARNRNNKESILIQQAINKIKEIDCYIANAYSDMKMTVTDFQQNLSSSNSNFLNKLQRLKTTIADKVNRTIQTIHNFISEIRAIQNQINDKSIRQILTELIDTCELEIQKFQQINHTVQCI